jgi:hypothetical protein
VIGDAPPHAETETALYEMVKKAHDQPFEPAKSATTGARKQNAYRPFITSTIATNPAAKPTFEKIAEAGGGTCVMLEASAAAPAGARGGRPDKGGAPAAKSSKSVQQIVEHILLLSFGAQHRAQLSRFVRTFFEYRDAGMFD